MDTGVTLGSNQLGPGQSRGHALVRGARSNVSAGGGGPVVLWDPMAS